MFDWNGNGKSDFGDAYIDYEIMNELDSGSANYSGSYRKRKKVQFDPVADAGFVDFLLILPLTAAILVFIGELFFWVIGGVIQLPAFLVSGAVLFIIRKRFKKRFKELKHNSQNTKE